MSNEKALSATQRTPGVNLESFAFAQRDFPIQLFAGLPQHIKRSIEASVKEKELSEVRLPALFSRYTCLCILKTLPTPARQTQPSGYKVKVGGWVGREPGESLRNGLTNGLGQVIFASIC